MNKKLLKISLLTLVAVAITGLSLVSSAQDAAPAASDKPAKTKFSGMVTAVDASAKTFTVDGQTYTVTDDSKISRNGKAATLADVVVGDPVKGSYTKGDDGKLDVTKVGFGKSGSKHKKSDAGASSTNAPASTPPNQ